MCHDHACLLLTASVQGVDIDVARSLAMQLPVDDLTCSPDACHSYVDASAVAYFVAPSWTAQSRIAQDKLKIPDTL